MGKSNRGKCNTITQIKVVEIKRDIKLLFILIIIISVNINKLMLCECFFTISFFFFWEVSTCCLRMTPTFQLFQQIDDV